MAASCTSDDPAVVSATEQAVGDGLKLEVVSPTDVSGQFWGEYGTVRFSSHAVFGRTVTATMEVGESRISIAYDAREGEAGSMALDIRGPLLGRERMVLGEFARVLYDQFPEAGDARQPCAGLLRTYADYLEAWSLGPTNPKIVINIPARRLEEREHPIPGDPGPPPPKPPTGGGGPACNVTSDNDFVTELSQCCNGGAMVQWQHDSEDHCFTTGTNMCGWNSLTSGDPLATQCPGRCGNDCFPAPLHTQDCLDHDLCLVHHPGFALDPWGNCGDELLEAFDDFGYIYVGRLGWFYPLVLGCNY